MTNSELVEAAAKIVEPVGDPPAFVYQDKDGNWLYDLSGSSNHDDSVMAASWCDGKNAAAKIRALGKDNPSKVFVCTSESTVPYEGSYLSIESVLSSVEKVDKWIKQHPSNHRTSYNYFEYEVE